MTTRPTIWAHRSVRPPHRVGEFQSSGTLAVLGKGYDYCIAQGSFCLSRRMAREFKHRSRRVSNRREAPRRYRRTYIDNGEGAIEVNDIDRKAHPESMNAMAGHNPKPGPVREVLRAEAE